MRPVELCVEADRAITIAATGSHHDGTSVHWHVGHCSVTPSQMLSCVSLKLMSERQGVAPLFPFIVHSSCDVFMLLHPSMRHLWCMHRTVQYSRG